MSHKSVTCLVVIYGTKSHQSVVFYFEKSVNYMKKEGAFAPLLFG